MNYQKECTMLLDKIPKKEKERVFSQDECELCSDFLGFIDTYKALSEIIPTEFMVIDFGCAYNAQSYYFENHKAYIGVQPPCDIAEIFCPDNCTVFRTTTLEFIKDIMPKLDVDISRTFAIVNFVPNWHNQDSMRIVADNFRNMYCFYPCENEFIPLKL